MSAKTLSRPRRAAGTPPADVFAARAEARATALLTLAAPVAPAPSPAVRRTLLARVHAAQAAAAAPKKNPAAPTAGWRFAALAAGDADAAWLPVPLPGVRLREITVDAARDTALVFVEMQPGAVFPDHTHAADERGLVLSGDLTMAGRRLGAGDFYEAAAGTRHERIASPSGCTGLLWLGARAWQAWRGQLAAS
ncbi:MAG: hypothetical protein RLZZ15_71 [Verrucomicrobiota bacterium]|jgi:anti-sigma factor ChrR (cupin superfamily)